MKVSANRFAMQLAYSVPDTFVSSLQRLDLGVKRQVVLDDFLKITGPVWGGEISSKKLGDLLLGERREADDVALLLGINDSVDEVQVLFRLVESQELL